MILDIGCGRHPRGHIGIDITRGSVQNPTSHLDKIIGYTKNEDPMLIQATGEHLPLRSSSVSEVLVIHSLEHMRCPYKALEEVKRVLRKGGKLIIVVPNPQKNRADWIDKTHIYSWTEAAIQNLLEALGYKVIEKKLIVYSQDIYVAATPQ